MATTHKITNIEYMIIKAHNDYCTEIFKRKAMACRQIPVKSRPEYVQNDLAYCNHAVGALKFCTAQARQLAGVKVNADT